MGIKFTLYKSVLTVNLIFSYCNTCVAIVQLRLYTVLRTLLLGRGLYIVHEAGRRRWSGMLSNLVCRRRRLPPLLVVASSGGR